MKTLTTAKGREKSSSTVSTLNPLCGPLVPRTPRAGGRAALRNGQFIWKARGSAILWVNDSERLGRIPSDCYAGKTGRGLRGAAMSPQQQAAL